MATISEALAIAIQHQQSGRLHLPDGQREPWFGVREIAHDPLLLEKQHRALFSGRGDESPNVKGGKAVKDGRRGGHQSAQAKRGRLGGGRDRPPQACP